MQRYTTHDIVDLVCSDTGEIVLHSEAQAEIARLQAQLAEWQASQTYRYIGRDGKPVLARDLEDRAERAEAQLAAMTAERDALVGAAYEEAAQEAYKWWDDDDAQELREHIRALTPEHAIATLDRIRAQAKADGLREAADKFEREDRHWGAPIASALRALAAAQKEAGGMKEWQKHIQHPHEVDHPGKAICGATIGKMEWAYTDIDHAFLSAPRDRIQPCPKCAAEIVKVFSECA